MNREIVIGRIYRHFKGTLYRVTGIATHTETKERLVIYQREDGTGDIWARPYTMFASEVDHNKYPDVKQKYRFEEARPKSATKPKKTLGSGLH